MLNDENLNRVAYLETLKKKPFDLLLELIEIECFSYDFSEKKSISSNGKHISEVLKEKYNLFVSEFILDKWISSNFELKNSKLILKNNEEEISYKINSLKQRENDFLRKMNEIKQDFIHFALNEFNKKITNEEAKVIFDSYIYSAANALLLNKPDNVDSVYYFIFQEYLKKLLKTDVNKLSIIENYGIANQIQDLILYTTDQDENFLKDCHVFLDTPILMKRLGYDGKSLHDNYKSFLNSLKKAGAKEYIFEHTLDEIWGILFNFKRSVALNILNAKGVNAFLEARKEFSDAKEGVDNLLTLDKDVLRENIVNLGVEFVDATEETTLNSDFDSWDFDEKRFVEILKQESASQDFFKSWMEKDKKSVSAIHRMRTKEHITNIKNYKDGKYYLLIDNYVLIAALKKYYEEKEFYPHRNELLLESTVLFQLWQQTGENGNIIRSLFRSKCFAMNVIDDSFRDRLYKNARRLEAYNQNLQVKDSIIDNPDFENELYSDAIRENKTLDEAYISSTLENKITDEKKKFREEIKQKDKKIEEERASKTEMSLQIRKLTKLVQDQNVEYEQDKNKAVEETRAEEKIIAIDRLAQNLQIDMGLLEKIKLFIKRKICKSFNEKDYFYQKAQQLLE